MHQASERLPYLLMLHGFMGDSESFAELLPRLCSVCNPVTVDLLGHGCSDSCTNPERYRLEKQADDLTSLLSRLQLNSVFLYGYSMGGRIALEVALQNHVSAGHNRTFQGLILESAAPGIADPDDRAERRKTDARRADQIRTSFESFLEEWVDMPLFDEPHPDAKQEIIHKYLRNENASIAAAVEGASPGFNPPHWTHLKTLDLPVLLIGGGRDQTYVDILRKMRDLLPRCTMEIVPDVAHRVHFREPEKTAAAISAFIRTNTKCMPNG